MWRDDKSARLVLVVCPHRGHEKPWCLGVMGHALVKAAGLGSSEAFEKRHVPTLESQLQLP